MVHIVIIGKQRVIVGVNIVEHVTKDILKHLLRLHQPSYLEIASIVLPTILIHQEPIPHRPRLIMIAVIVVIMLYQQGVMVIIGILLALA